MIAVTDVVFLYQVANGAFRPGTPLSGLSVLAVAFIAFAAWVPAGRPSVRGDVVPGLAVPATLAVGCLVLLAWAASTPDRALSGGAVALAVLGCAGVGRPHHRQLHQRAPGGSRRAPGGSAGAHGTAGRGAGRRAGAHRRRRARRLGPGPGRGRLPPQRAEEAPADQGAGGGGRRRGGHRRRPRRSAPAAEPALRAGDAGPRGVAGRGAGGRRRPRLRRQRHLVGGPAARERCAVAGGPGVGVPHRPRVDGERPQARSGVDGHGDRRRRSRRGQGRRRRRRQRGRGELPAAPRASALRGGRHARPSGRLRRLVAVGARPVRAQGRTCRSSCRRWPAQPSTGIWRHAWPGQASTPGPSSRAPSTRRRTPLRRTPRCSGDGRRSRAPPRRWGGPTTGRASWGGGRAEEPGRPRGQRRAPSDG